MLARALFDLAARGYQFPREGVLRINREFRPVVHPTAKIRAMRAFYAGGKLLEPGDTVTVPLPEALEAEALRRAARV